MKSLAIIAIVVVEFIILTVAIPVAATVFVATHQSVAVLSDAIQVCICLAMVITGMVVGFIKSLKIGNKLLALIHQD